MPIRIRCHDKPWYRTKPTEQKGLAQIGNHSNRVLCGQKTQTPHLMRINLIIVVRTTKGGEASCRGDERW